MKAFSALRLLACAGLLSFAAVTKSSAQLFQEFHLVSSDSFPGVDAGEALGIAVDIKFTFFINTPILTLQVEIKNLGGTPNQETGSGNYPTGVITGFGFDAPAGGLLYTGFTDDPNLSINFNSAASPWVLSNNNPDGTFDHGIVAASPAPGNGVGSGETATFTFTFSGDSTNFAPGNFFANNGSDADFGFRVTSMDVGAGSDKFVYYDNPPIPEPSTYGVMAALLLLGVVGVKRFRAAKKLVSA